jgi:hypothetical protein
MIYVAAVVGLWGQGSAEYCPWQAASSSGRVQFSTRENQKMSTAPDGLPVLILEAEHCDFQEAHDERDGLSRLGCPDQ